MTRDNENVKSIASQLGLTPQQLVELNKSAYPSLRVNSRFKADTSLIVVPTTAFAAAPAAATARRGAASRAIEHNEDMRRGGEDVRTTQSRARVLAPTSNSVSASTVAAPRSTAANLTSSGVAAPMAGRSVGIAVKALQARRGVQGWTVEETSELHRVRLEVSPEHRSFWEQAASHTIDRPDAVTLAAPLTPFCMLSCLSQLT